jgi:hypothetical protein
MRSFSLRRRTPATPPPLVLPPVVPVVTYDPRAWYADTYSRPQDRFPGSQRAWVRREVDDRK